MITHDLAVIAEMADKIIIMKEGEIIESGSINILKKGLKSVYSKTLFAASDYKSKNINKISSEKTLLEVKNVSRDYSDNSISFFKSKKIFKKIRTIEN